MFDRGRCSFLRWNKVQMVFMYPFLGVKEVSGWLTQYEMEVIRLDFAGKWETNCARRSKHDSGWHILAVESETRTDSRTQLLGYWFGSEHLSMQIDKENRWLSSVLTCMETIYTFIHLTLMYTFIHLTHINSFPVHVQHLPGLCGHSKEHKKPRSLAPCSTSRQVLCWVFGLAHLIDSFWESQRLRWD